METPLSFNIFAINQVVSSHLDFWCDKIVWNNRTKRLAYTGESALKPKSAKLLLQAICNGLLTAALLIVILKKGILEQDLANAGTICNSVVYVFIYWLKFGFDLIIYLSRNESLDYMNSLHANWLLLSSDKNTIRLTPAVIFKKLVKEMIQVGRTRNGDVMGIFATVGIVLVSFLPTIIFTASLFEIGNTYCQAIKALSPSLQIYFPIRLVTSIMLIISAQTFVRTLRTILCSFTFPTTTTLRHLNRISARSKRNLADAVREYRHFYYLHYTKTLYWGANLLLFLTQVGFYIMVFTWSAAVLGSGILPKLIYFICIGSALGGSVFIILSLNLAQESVDKSENLIRTWTTNLFLFRGSPNANMKLLRSLHPIGFPVHGYGHINREYKTNYITRTIVNSQDLILTLQPLFL